MSQLFKSIFNSGSLSTLQTGGDDHRLDFTKIVDRLYVCGQPWKRRTEKGSRRNNVNELGQYLNSKFKNRYLLFDICIQNDNTSAAGTQSPQFQTEIFNHQVVRFKSSSIYDMKLICDIMQSLWIWLKINDDGKSGGVAAVMFSNSLHALLVVGSCYLRYAGLLDNVREAYEFMHLKLSINQDRSSGGRSGSVDSSVLQSSQTADLFINLVSPSTRRLLHYFDDTVTLKGKLPNRNCLKLHGFIFNGLLKLQKSRGFKVQLWNSYYSTLELVYDSEKYEDGLNIVRDEFNTMFKVPVDVMLSGDVEIRVINGQSTVSSFYFNTAFMGYGLIRIDGKEFNVHRSFDVIGDSKDDQWFVDFIFSSTGSTTADSKYNRTVSFETAIAKSPYSHLLSVLSDHHYVRWDSQLLQHLLVQKFDSSVARFSLQRCCNQMHEAHEYAINLQHFCSGKMTIMKVQSKQVDQSRSTLDLAQSADNFRQLQISDSLQQSVQQKQSTSDSSFELSQGVNEESALSQDVSFINNAVQQEFQEVESQQDQSQSLEGQDITPDQSLQPSSSIGNQSVPPSPPPPPPPPINAPSNRLSPSKKVKHKFYWDEIKPQQLVSLQDGSSSSSNNNLWTQVSQKLKDTSHYDIDIEKFEQLFLVDTQSKPSGSSISKPKQKQTRILDINRARLIGIVLSKLLKKFQMAELFAKVMDQNIQTLSVDEVQSLGSILPSESEIKDGLAFMQALKNGTFPEVQQLDLADQFLLEVCKQPLLDFALQLMQFRLTFKNEFDSAIQKLSLISSTCQQLVQDQRIQQIMAVILKVGNMINHEYSAGSQQQRAVGFKLDSLLKLNDVKAKDNKTTLMQFLVITLLDQKLEFDSFLDSYLTLDQMRHLDSNEIVNQINTVKFQLQSLQNYQPLQIHYMPNADVDSYREQHLNVVSSDCQDLLTKAEQQVSNMKTDVQRMYEYFGEEYKSLQDSRPERTFEIFYTFFQNLRLGWNTALSQRQQI
ncbi:hypothetical protein MP228_004733 [Amoeboaphelidium protococcarum]|nr:hypothetical protein MP228_004733 [Amoeboaphelidium protococcarum]